ncbi:uncharacterized protein STEHIDRAFT_146223 [Stereum hirsutum FP-91666 SS1]|uniref:uncharacterized protein n=1 Tax=Stereum hirsutum (strain FP-91666) TaxID=721885 RepID=UPI000440C43C|nr:uncharacterized protein STEHIDRAFT_146223 [Stereum hirsutum FP-91666 SS1]EIM88140.1 hypothetical protein STEHIDRAFT_146223 [Stereum hirsutum FP-91666 SS1]
MAVLDVERRGLLDGLGSALDGDAGSTTATTTSSNGGLLSGLTSALNPVTSSTASTTSSVATTTSTTSSTTSLTTASTTSSSSSSSTQSTTSSTSSSSSLTSSSSSTLSSTSTTPSTSSSPSSTVADSSATITPTASPSSESIIVTSSQGQVVTLTSVVQATPTASSSPQVATSFLENKSLSSGVFAVVGIIGFVILVIIGTMFIRRRSRKRLDREIDEVVSFEPTTDHYGEKDGTTGGAWPARYSTGSTAQGSIHNGSDGTHGQPGYGAAMPTNRYSNGPAYGQQQQMTQNGYPGYGGNQAYQGYNIPAQNQAYPAPAPPRSPAVAYDPARAASPPNPIAPYSAPVLPQLNFASTGPQFVNIASEKPLPAPALYPGQAQSSEEASYTPVERAPAGNASSETRHSPSNSVERQPSTPVLAYAAAPEQGSRLSNATAYGGAPASVDERAGYTPGGLTVANA